MLITQNEYDLIFKGYYINGVAIRDTGFMYFTLREIRPDLDPIFEEKMAKKKFVSFIPHAPNSQKWGYRLYEAFNKLCSTVTSIPLSQYIGIDSDGEVYIVGSGVEELEDPIPGEHTIFGCSTIGGRAYVVGGGRYMARRLDRNQWQHINNGMKKPTREEHLYSAGFECVDGFSESDIYAGGGKGDLWHFNGDSWRPIPFPSNMYIESICCAGDGFVYIGAQSGTVFKGREDHWVMISHGGLSLPFRQMVWYQDRVWATSDYGIWQITNDEVISADLPNSVTVCAGYICCNDKTLVVAGANGAARLEEGKWDILINCFEAEKANSTE